METTRKPLSARDAGILARVNPGAAGDEKGKYYRVICIELRYVNNGIPLEWRDALKASVSAKYPSLNPIDEEEWKFSLAWAIADLYCGGCEEESY